MREDDHKHVNRVIVRLVDLLLFCFLSFGEPIDEKESFFCLKAFDHSID